MEASRWPRVMVPDSLIFFRVPVSSAANTGVLISAAVMATPNRWGTIRIDYSSNIVFFMEPAGSLGRTLCVAAEAFDAKSRAGVVPDRVQAVLPLISKDIILMRGQGAGANR